ncbi:MAG: MMPL family transporter [Actinomycetaceae bacterium]|nr:MMPL family transporter [Actinomycetaceae bacterium]MDY5854905.1 MMPL family transporter [Arcanobacterium sp.]
MSSVLLKIGRWCARHSWRVLIAWILALGALGFGFSSVGMQLSNSFNISSTESMIGVDILRERLPQASGVSETVLISVSDEASPDGAAFEGTSLSDAATASAATAADSATSTAANEQPTSSEQPDDGGQPGAGGDLAIDQHRAAIEKFVSNVNTISGISMASDPFAEQTRAITADGKHALIQVQTDSTVAAYSANADGKANTVKNQIASYARELESSDPALSVLIGGNIGQTAGVELSIIEALGVLVAAAVLFVTFGSLLAAGIPIISAVVGVGVGMLGILVAANFTDINAVTPVLAVMIGLAVGIDYALFIMSRAREYLVQGISPVEAAGRAVATAGSAVVFAGITVIIALCGLAVCRIPFLTAMGVAAAFMVAVAVSVALTAIPAFLGLLGKRLIPKKPKKAARLSPASPAAPASSVSPTPPASPASPATPASRAFPTSATSAASLTSSTASAVVAATALPAAATSSGSRLATGGSRLATGWIDAVMRRPALFAIAVIALLGAGSVPLAGLSLSLVDNGYEQPGTQVRETYDAISRTFGEGYNSPIIVIADIVQSTDPLGLVSDLSDDLAAIDGVEKVAIGTPNQDASLAFIELIPSTGQANPATERIVNDIRADAPALEQRYGISNLMVTGITAVAVDIAAVLNDALLPFGIVVVGLSIILLMIVFRSIAVPLTATLGYVLSLGTGLGAVGAIFGWGWLADLFHVTKVGSVISFLPVIVMGILFGLAMDYEVFLVSRMRETWIHTSDARRAVREGFIGSAKVVTAAALIMTSVFAFFIPDGNKYIKPIAVALTVGIFADAFLVRMTFIPAIMALLGRRAWWIPAWLEKRLPMVDVEGEGLARTLEHSDWVDRHGEAEVRLDSVSVGDASGDVFSELSLIVRPRQFAVARLDTFLARSTLAALLAGRIQPHDGVSVISGRPLPDGMSAIQASTYMLDYPDASLIPYMTRLVVCADPPMQAWAALERAHQRGIAVLAIVAPDYELPLSVRAIAADAIAQAAQEIAVITVPSADDPDDLASRDAAGTPTPRNASGSGRSSGSATHRSGKIARTSARLTSAAFTSARHAAHSALSRRSEHADSPQSSQHRSQP